MSTRPRLDERLVAEGLAPDLATARGLIMAGRVLLDDRPADKPGFRARVDATVRVRGARHEHGYVSRGGLKLAGGLDHFGLDPTGWVAIDLGASTGGFTDCLLQRGARRVYAVDVAYGVLDWRLRQDPRVVVCERTHANALDDAVIPELVDAVVADISFNALSRLLGPALARLKIGGVVVLLVKPQFELPREAVGAGGVVRDPAGWQAACALVSAAVETLGVTVEGVAPAAITGADGNQEFLLVGRRSTTHDAGPATDRRAPGSP